VGDDTVDGGDGPGDVAAFTDASGPVRAAPSGALDDGFGNDETGQFAGIEIGAHPRMPAVIAGGAGDSP
jgi:hypothetical protein